MTELQKKLLEQYSEHYANINISLDINNPKRAKRLERMFGQYIDKIPTGGKVLDLGCASGLLLHWLTHYTNIEVIGVDQCAHLVEWSQNHISEAQVFHQDGLEFLQQHENHFYGIFCLDVLEHIPEELLFAWLNAIYRALKEGGFFICRVPNAANVLASYSRYIDLTHQRLFTSKSLHQLFSLVEFTKFAIIPIQAGHISGKLRLTLERLLHKILFYICGRGLENTFTSNICAIAFK